MSLPVLIRTAGRRWPAEECFQQGKGQAGLDQHQVRTWHSFHRHTVLSMCAQALLAIAAAQAGPARTGRPPPAPPASPQPGATPGNSPPAPVTSRPADEPGLVKVSVPEARRLARLATAPMAGAARQLGYAWSRWRRRHQARARWHHYQKIVYCKDANRRGDFEHASFDFLGCTFRGRLVSGPRGYFTGFNPAISGKAKKAKGKQIRDWHLNRRNSADLSGLADQINPQVRGWINYYGAFYRSELRFLAWRINEHLARWAMQKFKRFRGKYAKAMAWLQKVYQHQPDLFAHWQLIAFTASRTVGAG